MSEKIDCDYNRGGDQLIKVSSDFILAYAAHLLVGTNALKVLANLQQKKNDSIQGNFIVIADSIIQFNRKYTVMEESRNFFFFCIPSKLG